MNKQAMCKKSRRSGFTLVEIMVVVVIIGLLAAIVVPAVISRVEQARRTTAKTQIESFVSALEMYRLDNGSYPTTQQGLEALVKKPTLAPVPKKYPNEPYIKSVPPDPWRNPYIYRSPGERGMFDLISTGPDSEEGGEDGNTDITNHDQE